MAGNQQDLTGFSKIEAGVSASRAATHRNVTLQLSHS